MTTPDTVSPASSTSGTTGNRTAERLLAEVRGEIARADTKASVLVAALGMTAGVFTALLAGRDWSPGRLSGPGAAVWWAGAAALALSLVSLLLAVLPRYRTDAWAAGRPLCYFGDIQQAVREGRLAEALADTDRDPAAGLLAALAENSGIAASKHRWIRAGLIAFCTGTLLLPTAPLIG
ncbi:Pycsar system effector family protein [Streptomyces sp. NBC_00289]|uniref:Pycsar system effector family protein n=1 Tax=Streptomyces sp. NBC_00289 TaxID=2975703 RepID=UPI00352E6A39